jgi:small subunit ribosomal protein S1
VKQKYAVGTRHKARSRASSRSARSSSSSRESTGSATRQDLSIKPIQSPEEVVKVGEEIDVVVASCDSASAPHRPAPRAPGGEATSPSRRSARTSIVKVAVVAGGRGLGLLVRILGVTGAHARGFIPAGHTGTQRGTDLRKEFPSGTKLDAKVIEVDARRGETKLSIRALKDDAEKQAYQQYREQVNREAKFGTFADLMKK